MRKFKNKKTGAIYTVTTQSVVDAFLKNPEFTEIKEKETKAKKGADEETATAPEAPDADNESDKNENE